MQKKSSRIIESKLSINSQKLDGIDEVLPESFSTGRQIQWKCGEMIAEGRFCKIFQCMNTKTGELLVLKSYPTNRSSSGFVQELKKIRKEIGILKTIEHKGIMKIFQSETSSESLDLIMECIPGGCLQEIIEKYGPLEEEIIKNYLKQVIEAIVYLHAIGISHNNIKAENIFIASEGKIKLSGFKNFTYINENSEIDNLYHKPCIMHQFLAPEGINGGITETSDVWSIGCLAIQLASGKDPFHYLANDQDTIVKILGSKNFVFRYPNLSVSLKNFIETCMKVDPAGRPLIRDLLKHEAISGKKFSFDIAGDESLKYSLSRTADCHHAIAELDNES